MTEETTQLIQKHFLENPRNAPQGTLPVMDNEIAVLEAFWPHLDEHYRQFLREFGGGIINNKDIYGLRLAPLMTEADDVISLTNLFREERWPGSDTMLVLNVDPFGNPTGLRKDGKVWILDHDEEASQCLALNLEQYIREWALRVDPIPDNDYGREPWPENWRDIPPDQRT
jgi:hypothetical protein